MPKHKSVVPKRVKRLKRLALQSVRASRQFSLRKRHLLATKRLPSTKKQHSKITKDSAASSVEPRKPNRDIKRLRLSSELFQFNNRNKFGPHVERGIFVNYLCPREQHLQMQLENQFKTFSKELLRLIENASWQCRRDKVIFLNICFESVIKSLDN